MAQRLLILFLLSVAVCIGLSECGVIRAFALYRKTQVGNTELTKTTKDGNSKDDNEKNCEGCSIRRRPITFGKRSDGFRMALPSNPQIEEPSGPEEPDILAGVPMA